MLDKALGNRRGRLVHLRNLVVELADRLQKSLGERRERLDHVE
ncbi:MAG: hypothetical protein JWM76_2493 [Pseudonocardiales bacterium]|nr:hypothetical protein [Pseudonocardiales bacterium]